MRHVAYFTVVSAIGLLAGCAGLAQQQAKQQFAKDKAACLSAVPKVIGNYERRNQCVADAMERDLAPAFPNDSARIGQIEAHLVLLGQEVDQGKLSPEQARADMADYQAAVVADSQQAALERQQAAAAESAQLLGASAALMRASRPSYLAPMTTNCIQNGPFTNCTSQ